MLSHLVRRLCSQHHPCSSRREYKDIILPYHINKGVFGSFVLGPSICISQSPGYIMMSHKQHCPLPFPQRHCRISTRASQSPFSPTKAHSSYFLTLSPEAQCVKSKPPSGAAVNSPKAAPCCAKATSTQKAATATVSPASVGPSRPPARTARPGDRIRRPGR